MHLATILKQLIRQKATSAMELADVAEIGDSSVYRYLDEDTKTEPSWSVLRAWITRHPSAEVRVALLNAIASGAPGVVIVEADADLDTDGDGKVDALDAIRAMNTAASEMQADVSLALQAAASGKVNDSHLMSANEHGSRAIRFIATAMKVLQTINAAEHNRRHARRRELSND